jgi:iron-sulfur cluster repair protein YtfE (RIC family)
MNAIRDDTTGRAWSAPRELIDHIESVYHGYLRLTLSALDALIEQVAREHAVSPRLMDRLKLLCLALEDNLATHLSRQECRLFPKIRHIREPVGETGWVSRLENSLDEMMNREERENSEAMSLLQRIREVLSLPAWSNANSHVEQMKNDLNELYDSSTEHFHLETNVLFPAVREMVQRHVLAV